MSHEDGDLGGWEGRGGGGGGGGGGREEGGEGYVAVSLPDSSALMTFEIT